MATMMDKLVIKIDDKSIDRSLKKVKSLIAHLKEAQKLLDKMEKGKRG